MNCRWLGLLEAEVEDLHDVRVHEARRGQRLAAEAVDEVRVLGQVLGQQLDRDVALEAGVEGQLDGGHAADADPALEPVAAREEVVAHGVSVPAVARRRPGRPRRRRPRRSRCRPRPAAVSASGSGSGWASVRRRRGRGGGRRLGRRGGGGLGRRLGLGAGVGVTSGSACAVVGDLLVEMVQPRLEIALEVGVRAPRQRVDLALRPLDLARSRSRTHCGRPTGRSPATRRGQLLGVVLAGSAQGWTRRRPPSSDGERGEHEAEGTGEASHRPQQASRRHGGPRRPRPY